VDKGTEVDKKHDCPNKPTLISNAFALPFALSSLDSGMVVYPKKRAAVTDFLWRLN